ncbi:MAG: hypothetical protein P8009_03120 [Gammaproteobacteria bacterium]
MAKGTIVPILAVAMAALLPGCATERRAWPHQPAAASGMSACERVAGQARFDGLAVAVPDSGKWCLVKHTRKVMAIGYLYSRRHSAAMVVTRVFPPRTRFADAGAFDRYAIAGLQDERDPNERRLDFYAQAAPDRAPWCVRFYRQSTYPGDALTPEGYGFQEAGYLCRHPDDRQTFLRFAYSERYPASSKVHGFMARATRHLKAMRFSR